MERNINLLLVYHKLFRFTRKVQALKILIMFKFLIFPSDSKYKNRSMSNTIFQNLRRSKQNPLEISLQRVFGPSGAIRTLGPVNPNVCRNFQTALYRPLWPFPLLRQFIFDTLLPCVFQAKLSPFGMGVGLDSVY